MKTDIYNAEQMQNISTIRSSTYISDQDYYWFITRQVEQGNMYKPVPSTV